MHLPCSAWLKAYLTSSPELLSLRDRLAENSVAKPTKRMIAPLITHDWDADPLSNRCESVRNDTVLRSLSLLRCGVNASLDELIVILTARD
jgi:hypothetical protein